MNLIERIKDTILDNNYFETLAGERFREWNDIKDIVAVIAFSGRSRNQECYRLTSDSDSDQVYVTHLYIDRNGDIRVQTGPEDTDDFSCLLHPNGVLIETFDDDILEEWVNLFKF